MLMDYSKHKYHIFLLHKWDYLKNHKDKLYSEAVKRFK